MSKNLEEKFEEEAETSNEEVKEEALQSKRERLRERLGETKAKLLEDFLNDLEGNSGAVKRVQAGDRMVEYLDPQKRAKNLKQMLGLLEELEGNKSKKVKGIRLHKLTESKNSKFERII